MKKQNLLIGSLAIFVVMALAITTWAYADDSQFNYEIQVVQAHRAQMEAMLGLDPRADTYPHATSYYDDLVDHYEQVLIMSDFIDKGIR